MYPASLATFSKLEMPMCVHPAVALQGIHPTDVLTRVQNDLFEG